MALFLCKRIEVKKSHSTGLEDLKDTKSFYAVPNLINLKILNIGKVGEDKNESKQVQSRYRDKYKYYGTQHQLRRCIAYGNTVMLVESLITSWMFVCLEMTILVLTISRNVSRSEDENRYMRCIALKRMTGGQLGLRWVNKVIAKQLTQLLLNVQRLKVLKVM